MSPEHHSLPISAMIQGTSESCSPPGACPTCGHEVFHFSGNELGDFCSGSPRHPKPGEMLESGVWLHL